MENEMTHGEGITPYVFGLGTRNKAASTMLMVIPSGCVYISEMWTDLWGENGITVTPKDVDGRWLPWIFKDGVVVKERWYYGVTKPSKMHPQLMVYLEPDMYQEWFRTVYEYM